MGIYEPQFSASSFGFRPGRGAHDALRQAQGFVESGKTWVVDLDLEKYFDTVNHDRLMARLSKDIKDKRVLKLIRWPHQMRPFAIAWFIAPTATPCWSRYLPGWYSSGCGRRWLNAAHMP